MRAKYLPYLLSLLLICAFDLRAQDFFGAGVSAQTASRAGIYVPGNDNALDAISLNPAGLAYLTRPVINLNAMGLLARGDFSNAANQNSPMRFNAGIIPYGAIGIPLGKRWTLAAGFLPDLLSSAKWQFRDAPGVGGATYGPQSEQSKIVAFRTTGGIAYRVSTHLSVGMTISSVYNSNTLIMPYVFQSNPSLKGLKTLLDLHTAGFAWNTSFGLIAQPSRHWQLGASFRTRSLVSSSGTATGNLGVQFAALNIPFRPDFAYRAGVKVELPQSGLFSAACQKSSVLRLFAESTWTNWNSSFANLPVSLSKGNNSDINSLLKSGAIRDVIPLNWKDQFSFRAGAERKVGENFLISGGYAHQNNPVPSSTLSPLTAAIMQNSLTTGFGTHRGPIGFDVAYLFNLTAGQNVQTSSLLSGEFDQSRVHVGTQSLIMGLTFHP